MADFDDLNAPIDDEEFEQARAALQTAIAAFYATCDPDAYVDAWVLVTHRRRPDLERQAQSCVGVVTADEQAFPMTTGLLTEALDAT